MSNINQLHLLPSPSNKFPCGDRCEDDCELKNKILHLKSLLEPLKENSITQLIDAFWLSYKNIFQKNPSGLALNLAIPALFDLICSAEYARRMIADSSWTYCSGVNTNESPSLYFTFLKTCPRCSVKRGTKPPTGSNKPGSDAIGEIAGKATALIVSKILSFNNPEAKVLKVRDRQHDVDLVIYDESSVILAEIKSSPLVIFPLEIQLSRQLTEVREGETVSKSDHSKATTQIHKEELFFYLPHKDIRIPLGTYNTTDWIYPELIKFVQVPSNVENLILAWSELYLIYSLGRRGKEVDNRRWITCGCGGKVDDTKNAPGLDRTDDLKKGTYQILKYGAYYKAKCEKRNIYSVLFSNFFCLNTLERYLLEIQDIIWTKKEYALLPKESPEIHPDKIKSFKEKDLFNLFDGILCFTGSFIHNEKIKEDFSFDKLTRYLLE